MTKRNAQSDFLARMKWMSDQYPHPHVLCAAINDGSGKLHFLMGSNQDMTPQEIARLLSKTLVGMTNYIEQLIDNGDPRSVEIISELAEIGLIKKADEEPSNE